jgi:hypothetical protein
MRDESEASKRTSRATLEIVGVPGESVSIYAETPLDAPPPPIFEGEFPGTGRIRLRVPRTSLVVVAAGFGQQAVRFDSDERFQTVDLRPPR